MSASKEMGLPKDEHLRDQLTDEQVSVASALVPDPALRVRWTAFFMAMNRSEETLRTVSAAFAAGGVAGARPG
jgi:hypothetical protein